VIKSLKKENLQLKNKLGKAKDKNKELQLKATENQENVATQSKAFGKKGSVPKHNFRSDASVDKAPSEEGFRHNLE